MLLVVQGIYRSACFNLVFHPDVVIEGATTKSFMTIEGERVSAAMIGDETLNRGTPTRVYLFRPLTMPM